MSILIVLLVLVGMSALVHRFVTSRLIANLLPANLVTCGLVGYEALVLQPDNTSLGGMILPFIFMAVLTVSLFVGMAMNLLRLSAFSRQA